LVVMAAGWLVDPTGGSYACRRGGSMAFDVSQWNPIIGASARLLSHGDKMEVLCHSPLNLLSSVSS
jgi:hypothetical protein